jgi:broad specificity phosphatase PhoE
MLIDEMTQSQSGASEPQVEEALEVPSSVPDNAELWLIRHGETEWSKSGRHTGRTDIPLTPAGEQQAIALRGLLGDRRPALVLCSPRQRARRTAELAGFAVDAIDEDLAEWDYGDYEGRTTHDIRQSAPGWSLFADGVPNGETAAQVSARADRVLAVAGKHLADGPVVLIAHGHICRVLGARWIGMKAENGANLLLDTAAPSLLTAQYGESAIAHWNLPNPGKDTR